MITKENYYQEIKSIGVEKLPTPMQEMHAMIDELTQKGKDWADYKTDAEIKESVDVQFKKLYEWIKKNEVIETPKKSSPKKHADRRKGHKPVRKASTKKKEETPVKAKKEPKKTSTPKNKKATTLVKASKSKIDSWNVFKAENKKANKEMYFAYVEMMHAKGVEIPASISKQMEAFQKQSDEPVTMDLKFIKRFVKLNGKTVSKQDLQRYIKSLQKAIRDRQINKHSKYKSQIEHIQHILVNLHNQTKEDVFILKINEDTIKKYEKILNSFSPMIAVKLLKRFVLLQGKNDVDKIERLIEDITNEIKNLDSKHFYYKALMEAKLMLNKARQAGVVKISEQELNGLLGFDCFCSKKKSTTLGGFDKLNNDMEQLKRMIPNIQPKYGIVVPQNNLAGSNKPNESHVVSAQEVLNRKYQVLNFVGKFKKLLGDPELGFSMMIFGKPKSGKSTFAIDFAQYLAENHGKVLFVSVEEGISHTLADKIKRLQANSKNLFFDKQIPSDLKMFDFVFIDSINRAKLSIAELIELQNKYPNKTFVYIFQVTKDGNFRGSQEFEHEVDIVVNIDSGIASAKGRYAQGESIDVRF